MPPIFESLGAIFLIMAIGWATRVSGLIAPDQWHGFERVTYYILMPALVITTLVTVDVSQMPLLLIGTTMLLPVVAMTVTLLLLRGWLERRLAIYGPAFTSVLQGAIRWNSFVGIALASVLFGQQGLAVVAVALAMVVPVVNLISVYALTRYGSDAKPLEIGSFLKQLLCNPFIWSTLLGAGIAASGIVLPKVIMMTGDIIGKAALAAGLVLVGSGLELRNLRHASAALWMGTVLRLVVMPLLTGAIGIALGLSGPQLVVPVIAASVPTAAASYIMARQNGGDAPLMASIVTLQTIVAALTLPFMLWLFGRL